MNLIDTSKNSPNYFYWKRIGITNENLNFDIRVQRVKLLLTGSEGDSFVSGEYSSVDVLWFNFILGLNFISPLF